jgi:hypothetical protein
MRMPNNPTGKGLNTRYDLDEEGLSLAQQIMKFNLLVMRTFEGKADSPEELANRFATYFEMCLEHGRIPTVEGLALVSGFSRSHFYDIAQGKFRPEISDIVKKAKDYIATYDAEMVANGKIPAPVYIFRSKNYYGMKDVQEVKVEANQNSQIPENAEEIIDKLPEREDLLVLESGEASL